MVARGPECLLASDEGGELAAVSGEPTLFLTSFVGFSCRSAARTSRARFAEER